MVKMFMKKKSKRITSRKRFKIEKKVREHNRKLRKLDKEKKGKRSKNKLIIVPGDCPFKEKILAEATALKESVIQAKFIKHEEFKEKRKAKKEQLQAEKLKRGVSNNGPHNTVKPKSDPAVTASGENKPKLTFEDLLKKAEERGYFYEKVAQKNQADASLKAFYKEFQTVVSESDVVIQVLDARDPLGTRSDDAEESVRNHSDKRLMMVLNKCDLVPPENLQKWIAYLKQTSNCAVLPFKANTQKQKDRLGSIGNVNDSKGIDTKKSVGVSDLLGLLGTWARGAPGGITVGVIGMPNVGKSSLINSLKRSKACNVGAKPGITRTCQIINLDSKLKLIDSPGICFSKETGNESITIEKILSRVPKSTLMLHYHIPDFEDSEDFLCHIAMKFGQLKKGGIPNTASAENKLVQDWHTGAIRFFTEPPELTSSTTSTAIVSTMSEPFSLDNFISNEEKMAEDEDSEDEDEDDDDEEAVEMSEDEDEDVEVKPSPNVRVTRSAARKSVSFAVDAVASNNIKSKRMAKRQNHPVEGSSPDAKKTLGLKASKKTIMKKLKKTKTRNVKKVDNLADCVENLTF